MGSSSRWLRSVPEASLWAGSEIRVLEAAPPSRRGSGSMARCLAGRFVAACLGLALVGAQAQPASERDALDLPTAVQRALTAQPRYLMQRQANQQALGAVQSQRGRFDPNFFASIGLTDSRTPLNEALRTAAEQVGIEAERSLGRNRKASTGVQQALESGLQWQAEFSLDSSFDQTSSLQGVPRQNQSSLTLALRKPLMRGADARVVRGELTLAEMEAQASAADTVHAASQLVAEVAQAYWQVALQQRLLQIAQDVEQRALGMRADVARLVRDGQLPAAELETTEALYQSRKGQRIAHDQALFEARSALAVAMGQEHGQAAQAVEIRTQALPTFEADRLREWLDRVSAQGLDGRWDLRALEHRLASQQLRTELASDQKRGKLDWVVSLKSQGLGERSTLNWPGPPGKGSVVYIGIEAGLPLRNDAALGLERQQLAVLEQYRQRQQQLLSSIAFTSQQAREGLRRVLDQVAAARIAAASYTRVLRNENTKRQLGQITLLDLMNTESTYVEAMKALASAEQAVVVAVTKVAYESGLLVRPQGATAVTVDFEVLQGRQ